MGRIIFIAKRQVAESASLLALARRVKATLGWNISDVAARTEVAHMLSPTHPRRHFPAECLPDLLWVTERNDVLRELQAVWSEVRDALDDEAELYADARKPRVVRRGRSTDEEVA